MQSTDEQQLELFKEEGGLLTGNAEKDPVSGNDVPPGSKPEEVRDDIPAMLSENEYVVPADVVRYYGVKFFEDLRSQAKEGLMSMERNGRIGGEPVDMQAGEEPLTPEEEMMLREMMGMANGGMVPQQQNNEVMTQMTTQGYNPMERQQMLYSVPKPTGNMRGFQEGGLQAAPAPDYSKMFEAYMQPGGIFNYMQQQKQAAPAGNIVYMPYVNQTGAIINVPMIDTDGDGIGDKVQEGTVIPEGYRPQSEVAAEVSMTPAEKEGRDEDTSPEPNTDPTNWGVEDFDKALRQKDFTQGLAGAVGLVAPPLGAGIDRGFNRVMRNAAEELAERLKDEALEPDVRTRLEALQEQYKEAGYTPSGKKEGLLEGISGDLFGGLKNAFNSIFGTKETPPAAPPSRPATTAGRTPATSGDRDGGGTAPRSPAPTPRPESLGGDRDGGGRPASGVSSSAPSVEGATVGSGVGQVDRGLAAGVEAKAKEMSDELDPETGRANINKGGLIEKPNRPKKTTSRGKRGLGKK